MWVQISLDLVLQIWFSVVIKKIKIFVERLKVVKLYNQSVGGVDK